jgi:hypothetical protein
MSIEVSSINSVAVMSGRRQLDICPYYMPASATFCREIGTLPNLNKRILKE